VPPPGMHAPQGMHPHPVDQAQPTSSGLPPTGLGRSGVNVFQAGLGPAVPGLVPLQAREPAFDQVLSYRTYRLVTVDTWANDPARMEKELRKISKFVGNIRSFNHAFTEFDGRDPIDVLRFLAELKDACDSTGVHEGAAVKLLPYFLKGDAQVYMAGVARKGRLLSGGRGEYTWPHAVQALLTRYASDDILSSAYDAVTRITQASTEDENAFADRLQEAALMCANVFTQRDLVNYFVKGLRPGIRAVVSNTVSRADEQDFLAVRRIAQAQGDTFRATRNETMSPKPRLALSREGAKKKALLLQTAQPRGVSDEWSDTTDSSVAEPPVWGSPIHPVMLLGGAAPVPDSPASTGSRRSGESLDITDQSGVQAPAMSAVPVLDRQQLALANTLIPVTPVPWRCSGCRQNGHILYTCPYLPYMVRMYFAYANHLYQQEPAQILARQQRRLAREQTKAKPSSSKGYSAGNPPTVLRRPDATSKKVVAFAGPSVGGGPSEHDDPQLGGSQQEDPQLSTSDSSSNSEN